MQTSMTTPTARQATAANLQLESCEDGRILGHSIDPITLAYLDFGLFKTMCKLGVSRERICSALTISYADLDYLRKLSMT
ncbi:MAG: hypothetical protein V7700_08370 [Halioglobus sp.]